MNNKITLAFWENINLDCLLNDVLETVDKSPARYKNVYRVSICLTDDVVDDLRSILEKLQ